MAILDSGNRTEFKTGAVRDVQEGKGRFDLVPLDVLGEWYRKYDAEIGFILDELEKAKKADPTFHLFRILYAFVKERNMPDMMLKLAKHFEDGANKYSERNWEKGIPIERYIDSATRHYVKYLAGYNDEPHDVAFVWNVVCAIWTIDNVETLEENNDNRNQD